MSSPRNEFAYKKRFSGNLRRNVEPTPVRVDTKARVTKMEMTSLEVAEYKKHANRVPIYYLIGSGGNLPVHTNLKSMGRHYFTW